MKNRKAFRAFFATMLCLAVCISLAGCSQVQSLFQGKAASPTRYEAQYDATNGTISVNTSIDKLSEQGVSLGDGLAITFDNGIRLSSVPLVTSGVSKPYVAFLHAKTTDSILTLSCSDGTFQSWETLLTMPFTSCTIEVESEGFYIDQQNAIMAYGGDRSEYSSDEEFANFREVVGGNIAKGRLYRSSSPCNNAASRAQYANLLTEKNGINFVLNLSEASEDEALSFAEQCGSPYYCSLIEDGNVSVIPLGFRFTSTELASKVVAGLRDMSDANGPYLVHCVEGKDRTGFVCLLLEALCGASYEEIAADYMKTYDSFCGITKESAKEKYDSIEAMRCKRILLVMTRCSVDTILSETANLDLRFNGADEDMASVRSAANPTVDELRAGATNYLLAAGMTQDEIDELVAKLCA